MEVERKHIREVLESVHWRISGENGATEILGLRPTTLHSRMKKLGISRQKTRSREHFFFSRDCDISSFRRNFARVGLRS